MKYVWAKIRLIQSKTEMYFNLTLQKINLYDFRFYIETHFYEITNQILYQIPTII